MLTNILFTFFLQAEKKLEPEVLVAEVSVNMTKVVVNLVVQG